MPNTSSVSLSGNADIDGVLSGTKWTDPNISFGFTTAMNQYGYTLAGFEALNTAQKTAVRGILDMIESYTRLVFTEATNPATATLRFAEENSAGTAYAYLPSRAEQGGDVWLNHTSYNNPLKGTYAYATFVHEIGHTLGLDHGQDGLAALPTNHDSLEYSVMTYRSFVGANLNGYTVRDGSYPQTLMLNDVAALQYMYGANYATNAGNTTYRWSATTGEMSINGIGQGASVANKVFLTVWDGGGTDTYDFSNYTTNLVVDLAPGGWTTTSAAQLADLGGGFYAGQFARGNIANAYLFQGNLASLIENAVGGTGNDRITGNQGNNTLNGGAGSDTLTGAGGDDTIIGGIGIDTCVWTVNRADCTISYDSSAMTFLIQSLQLGLDRVSEVEYFTFLDGTFAAETLVSAPVDTSAPTLASTSPADNSGAVATSANLVLTFSENVVAGAGNIVIHTANGAVAATIAASDTAQVSIAGKVVTVNPTANLAAGQGYYVLIDGGAFEDGAGNDFAGVTSAQAFNFTTQSLTFTGTNSANTLNGTAADEFFYGLGGNDTLNGNGGNDYFDGGSGRDRMTGGAGNDIYIVDSTSDSVVESAGGGTDTVRSSVSLTLASNVEDLELTGSSGLSGTGNGLANRLLGNNGANSLNGSGGNDTLYGRGGNDTLTGGSGLDMFVFDTVSGGNDRISDFSASDDTIGLSRTVFAGLGAVGALDTGAFHRGTAAADAADRLIYNASTGALFYDADGAGGAAQQQIATLSRNLALTSADFLVLT